MTAPITREAEVDGTLDETERAAPEATSAAPVRRRLVLASALMLFLELALIRWLGADVVHLGYFSNIVLMGSFLGVGLGFLRVRSDVARPVYFPVALVALAVFVLVLPVSVERSGSDVIYFTSLVTTGPPVWVTLPVVFLGVAVVLTGPGELVGACFRRLDRLEAYRYDLIGSLAGIAAFTALSFLRAPSVAWGVIVAAATLVLFAPRPPTVVVGCLLVLVGLLALESLEPGVSWSPYYKVTTVVREQNGGRAAEVNVNGIPHQTIAALKVREVSEPWYEVPYERTTRAS